MANSFRNKLKVVLLRMPLLYREFKKNKSNNKSKR